MNEDPSAEMEALTREIETVDAELKILLARQLETDREVGRLRRKKARLQQKLNSLYPYDALRIERNIR